MSTNETIAAIATAPGCGGVGIIRISGPESLFIAKTIIGLGLEPRYAKFVTFRDSNGEAIDQGLGIYFPGPNSFTGEDVVEFQAHGGMVVLDALLSRVLELGAKMARPGEFSERAFLNGKIDLVQAEAIADLISASSRQAANAAQLSLQGVFSKEINRIKDLLIKLRVNVEAAIDFSEEEIDFISKDKIANSIKEILAELSKLENIAKQGRLLREGISVVIVGEPNVGKSSLMNYFTGHDSAIVTDIPGTTRDVLREYVNLQGVPLHIIDTAGMRESGDVIEQEGIKRAWREIELADFVLLVVDSDAVDLALYEDVKERLVVIRNKIDLNNLEPKISDNAIYISVKQQLGLDLLEKYLIDQIGFQSFEGKFIARQRHLQAINDTKQYLQRVETVNSLDLLAEELRQAQQALGAITGEFVTDDLLGEIFSNFCVGK